MKKYKLIKQYPGYKKEDLGKIALFQDNTFAKGCYMFEGYYIPKDIENYPEFWQEVIEKDYEILSYFNKYNNEIYSVSNNGRDMVSNENINHHVPLKYAYLHYNIHSIKRLSDGEIFTIGDKVEDNHFKNKICVITEIKLFNNKIKLNYKNGENCQVYNKELNEIVKVKKPLFTTYDGVDIYPGNKYWEVYDDYKLSNSAFTAERDWRFSSNDLRFKTKDNAQEYCFLHKPALSLNDIRTYFKGDDDQWSEMMNNLESIVNKKF